MSFRLIKCFYARYQHDVGGKKYLERFMNRLLFVARDDTVIWTDTVMQM